MFNAVKSKAKYVLDADIEKCFDRIRHEELLKKINTGPTIRRQIKVEGAPSLVDGGALEEVLRRVPGVLDARVESNGLVSVRSGPLRFELAGLKRSR